MVWRGGADCWSGKGRVLRGAFSSTGHRGTDTGYGGSSRTQSIDKYEVVKVAVTVIGTIAAVSSFISYGVRIVDERENRAEIARVQNEAATEIRRIEGEWKSKERQWKSKEGQWKAEVARIEGEWKMSERLWKAEVERYKRDLHLAHTRDYEPYQAAISQKGERTTGAGSGGLEKEEKKN